jgi:hypothetical protein
MNRGDTAITALDYLIRLAEDNPYSGENSKEVNESLQRLLAQLKDFLNEKISRQ